MRPRVAKVALAVGACILLVVLSASGKILLAKLKPSLPEVPGKTVKAQRGDFATISLPDNGCVLVNNVWNKTAAPKNFEQEIFLADLGGKKVRGWRWRSGWQFPPTVVSQPQLVCGDKPWDKPEHPLPGFPFRAADTNLTVNFRLDMKATGTFNMAFSMWAVRSLPATKDAISHEIMIWTFRNGQVPAGRNYGSLTVQGTTYDVFVEEAHADASGLNKNRWTYVAFVPRTPVMYGPLDLTAFTGYLTKQNLLSADAYITSLEFGNEVTDGAGIVQLTEFSLGM